MTDLTRGFDVSEAVATNSPTRQLAVGTAVTRFHLAVASVPQGCPDTDQAAAHMHLPDLVTSGRSRNDTGIIAKRFKEDIDVLTANGAGSFAEANHLSRVRRDAEIISRHADVNPEVGKEQYGRLLPGAELTHHGCVK